MPNSKAEIRIRGDNFDFYVPLGEGMAQPTGGGAEYEEGKRPKADPVTLFTGNALLKMDVPILLDVWKRAMANNDDKSIEVWDSVEEILALCWGTDRADPPDFVVTGPIPFSGRRWQMEFPEFGGGQRHRDGRLLRQSMTLHLLEFNASSIVGKPHRSAERGHGIGVGTPAARLVRLDHPESLIQIAARVYGNASFAFPLGRYNNIRDTRRELPAGEEVLIPGKAEIEAEIGAIGEARKA